MCIIRLKRLILFTEIMAVLRLVWKQSCLMLRRMVNIVTAVREGLRTAFTLLSVLFLYTLYFSFLRRARYTASEGIARNCSEGGNPEDG